MKRSGELKRTSSLKRTTYMPRKREKPRRTSHADSDEPEYLDFLRAQRICGLIRASIAGRLRPELRAYLGRCRGRMEPEHERHGVGKGQKAPDRRAWECCSHHHRQRHSKRGVWFHLTLEQERELIAGNIDDARARYLSHGSRRASS